MTQENVLEIIRENPGISYVDIADIFTEIDSSQERRRAVRNKVYVRCRSLIKYGFITVEMVDGQTYATEAV